MRKILILTLLFISSLLVSAQKVNGRVYEIDSGNNKIPLVGANVVWIGTNSGTTTNSEGYFSIEQPSESQKIIISFVGYQNDTVDIEKSQSYIDHIMKKHLIIEDVVIRGSAKGAHFDRLSPIQTQVVSQHELKRAACCNLSESFETNASVDVSYSDAVTGAKQIQLLGLAGTYTQIQAENIPILRGIGSTFGLNYVPGSWMESIQVSKGTASVANGYESIAGQINVEYKKPWGEEKFFVNMYMNELGMLETNADYAANINDNLSTMFLVHSENFGNKVDHNMDSFLDHPKVNQYHFFNRWKYQKGNLETQIGLKYLTEERIAGQMNYSPKQSQSVLNPFGIDVNTSRVEGFSKVGYIFERPATSIGWIMSTSMHDQQSIFGLKNYNADQASFYTNLIFITYLVNTNHTIKTGLSYNYDAYNEKLDQKMFDRKEQVPGAYFEYTYKYLQKLTLMGGVRYDINSMYGSLLTPRFHFRYQPFERITFRGSLGKGYRTPSVLSENSYLFASSRNLVFEEKMKIEEAWNFGFNITQRYKLNNRELTISTDYYRTDFLNQYIVDMDREATSVFFYNLKGKSYSNSYQVEAMYQPINQFDLTLAYRYNDVRNTVNGELQQKPLISKYKGLVTLGYKTPLKKWQFDYTIQLNGGGRLPSTESLPVEYQRSSTFNPYTIMNAQITKYFRKWEMYIGIENLTGFKQKNPIIAAGDPYGEYFDASMVWGPITGRKIYGGFRMLIWK